MAAKIKDAEAEKGIFETAPAFFGPRISLVFAAQFLYVGLYLPYFPLWLQSNNLTPAQISTILSMSLVIRVLASSQVTSFADRQPDRATVVSWLYFASSLSILLYLWSSSFWTILFVTIVYNVFFNPVLPLLDAITLSGVRRFNADYGKIRIWGSVVFIIANLGGGMLLAGFDRDYILYFLIASMFSGALASLVLPRIGRQKGSAAPVSSREQRAMWRKKEFLLVLAGAGLVQASHAMIYGFGSIYWETLAFSGLSIGLLWAIGVAAEVLLFQLSGKLLVFFRPFAWIAIGAIAGILRWLLFPFADSLEAFFGLQLLHGLTFGAVHIGTMHYIVNAVPEDKIGSAQGVGFVLGGVAMGIGVFASGPIYEHYGVNGFYFMAAVSALGLACLAASKLVQPQSSGKGGETSEPG